MKNQKTYNGLVTIIKGFILFLWGLARKWKRRIKRFFKKRSRAYAVKQELIKKHREFDQYKLDLVVYPSQKVWIPKALPSEPPNGITYKFGPTGYLGSLDADYCVIPTEWRNVNSYGHWTFSELPLLYLAFSSPARNVVLPDEIARAKLPFQSRWLKVLQQAFPEKNIIELSKATLPEKVLIPVNHDTSTNNTLIGKCPYKYYHHARATPYLVNISDELKSLFPVLNIPAIKNIYINRKTRRLKNELEVQNYLRSLGFTVISPEDYSLDEQIQLFSNAANIMGFHGSALSNILYCNKSARILEIVDPDCVYPLYLNGKVVPGKRATWTYYHMLAQMKDITYVPVESEDYYISIDRLKNVVCAE